MANHFKFFIALSAVVLFASCEKAVFDEDSEEGGVEAPATARLNIITRGATSDENTVKDGRIYIFNEEGKCVNLLSTDEEDNTATVMMPAGTYNLYAVGGEDLSRFILPSQEVATPKSMIKRMPDKAMDDLLMKSTTVTIADGETLNQTIALAHKVICIDELEIQQVPVSVTKVEVMLTPLYSSVYLDGTYPDTPTESYRIILNKQGDEKTWKASPSQMLFPSKGMPNIKITFTSETGTSSYSYTATEEFPANHHYAISGTCKATQGVTLTGILTSEDWGEKRTITFDFDDDNKSYANPVAGKYCSGYYVVSADAAKRTAVLLSPDTIRYTAPAQDKEASAWLEAINTALAAAEKPAGVTNNWRLPTLAEAACFTTGSQAVFVDGKGTTKTFYATKDGELVWTFGKETSKGKEQTYGTTKLADFIKLRPVIDITY
jgi:hypothetical protein